MCGRFVAASPPADIAAYFDVEEVSEALVEPNWNVAPTSDVYVVYSDGGVRRLDPLHWGLIPSWAKDMSVGNRMINARAETIATKGAFKSSFAKRRCIVPADGFYEWQKVAGGKQPWWIGLEDRRPFAFAGLWASWKRPEGGELESCAILTTAAGSTAPPCAKPRATTRCAATT